LDQWSNLRDLGGGRDPVAFADDAPPKRPPMICRRASPSNITSPRGAQVEFPRSHEQAISDEQRLEAWDNSNSNVWSIPLPA
jgi:hypothetical protein